MHKKTLSTSGTSENIKVRWKQTTELKVTFTIIKQQVQKVFNPLSTVLYCAAVTDTKNRNVASHRERSIVWIKISKTGGNEGGMKTSASHCTYKEGFVFF